MGAPVAQLARESVGRAGDGPGEFRDLQRVRVLPGDSLLAYGATTGVVRDSVPYYHYDAGGAPIATLGPFPSAEVFRMVTAKGWTLRSLPFPRAPVTAVAGDRFYFGPAGFVRGIARGGLEPGDR